jgi:NAD(P)H dehydrogenase (quinone)
MILMTGANGHMGSAIVDFLREKSSAVGLAGLVRSADRGHELEMKGVELRIGDYFDPASMEEAMKGIDTLMFISGSNLQDRVKQHTNIVNAARGAGVKHIIYTSMLRAPEAAGNPIGSDHYQTEQLILSTGIPHTFFRETFYADVLPDFFGNAREAGHWSYASANQKVNLAARIDMAEALANILADAEPHKNMIYEIVGQEAFTFDQLTRMLSDAVGKTITYRELTLDEMKANLRKAGLDEAAIAGAAAVSEAIGNGLLNYKDRALETLLGRKPVGISAFLKHLVTAKREARLRK